jgi:predicted nuclease of restriction endonuclease-like (RecB) superfamily
MNFEKLIQIITSTHEAFRQNIAKAVNLSITVRNWLIGYYIAEYEQKGEDRAAYGEELLQKLADRINTEGFSYRNLKLFRQFYQVYPQVGFAISEVLKANGLIGQSVIAQSKLSDKDLLTIGQSAIAHSDKKISDLIIPPEKLIIKVSFTHLIQLLPIEDPLKRVFYENECIKGNWSVRELKRQITTLYYERCGMSKNPEKLIRMVQSNAEELTADDIIKSPFTFEFLGLKLRDMVAENDLEQALLDHLQHFLLELGYGFCFEARQKRIIIGEEYFFIDLVFYHRILKCHILIELKIGEFKHFNAGQLNTYLNYYKAEVMQPGDNLPIGILLVTDKNDALVEYATAGMNEKLFVSKYLVELPHKQELENYIKQELKKL